MVVPLLLAGFSASMVLFYQKSNGAHKLYYNSIDVTEDGHVAFDAKSNEQEKPKSMTVSVGGAKLESRSDTAKHFSDEGQDEYIDASLSFNSESLASLASELDAMNKPTPKNENKSDFDNLFKAPEIRNIKEDTLASMQALMAKHDPNSYKNRAQDIFDKSKDGMR